MEGTSRLLEPQQLNTITAIAVYSQQETLRRRARLLIGYDQGCSTVEAASQAGLSPRRVRFWRRQFILRGMDIFPEDEKIQASRMTSNQGISASGSTRSSEEKSDDEVSQRLSEPETAKISRSLSENPIVEDVAQIPTLARMESSGLQPLDPIAEAGRKIMAFHFAEMLSHEEGTRLGENPEELHDMRVATRRMRAAFDIFINSFEKNAIKAHLKGLKATGRVLGRVRDMDVFIEKAVIYQQKLPERMQPGLEPLLKTWRQEREIDRTQLLSHLNSTRYLEFKQKFIKFLQTPGAGVRAEADPPEGQPLLRDFAPVLIYNRLASVRAFDSILSNASLEQLHALRIEFKKLRYAIEFFKEVLGDQAKDVIEDLKKVQDHLGELNDARVAIEMISQFIEKWEARQSQLPLTERQSPETIVAFLAAKHAERFHLMVTFPETWAMFNRAEFRQNLALAVAAL